MSTVVRLSDYERGWVDGAAGCPLADGTDDQVDAEVVEIVSRIQRRLAGDAPASRRPRKRHLRLVD